MFLLQLSVCLYNARETASNSSRSIIINIERYKLEVLSQNGNGSGVGAMAPAASLFYSWDEDEDDGTPRTITLDCLLPTGVIVPLRVDKDNTLAEIKEVRTYSYQAKARKKIKQAKKKKIEEQTANIKENFRFRKLVLTLPFTRSITHLNFDTSIDADADAWCE